MIDVSYNAVKNGLVRLICEELKSLLDYLPRWVCCVLLLPVKRGKLSLFPFKKIEIKKLFDNTVKLFRKRPSRTSYWIPS